MFINVCSEYRLNSSDHPGDFEVEIPPLGASRIMRNVGVSNLRIPNRWYNVSSFARDRYKQAGSTASARANKTFVVYRSSTAQAYTVTLVDGCYTLTRLLGELGTVLAGGSSSYASVSPSAPCTACAFAEDPVTGLVTATYTVAAGTMLIQETPLAVQLGFMATGGGSTSTHATTQVGTALPALPRPKTIQILLSQLKSNNQSQVSHKNLDNLPISRQQRMLVEIPQDSEFGEDLVYYPEEPDWIALEQTPNGSMRIQVVDERGNILTLNTEWTMTLLFEIAFLASS